MPDCRFPDFHLLNYPIQIAKRFSQLCFVICYNLNYLQSGQVLKFCEVTELQVERVDADEGQDVEDVEEEPDDQHQDVVSKDHVVDNS